MQIEQKIMYIISVANTVYAKTKNTVKLTSTEKRVLDGAWEEERRGIIHQFPHQLGATALVYAEGLVMCG